MISRLFWAITLNGFHWCEKLQKGWVVIDHYAVEKKLTGDFIGYAAKAVLNLAKDAGIERLFSFTAKINALSESMMQKIGMEKAGEFYPPKLSNDSPLCIHVLYEIDL